MKHDIDPPYDLWPGIRSRIQSRRRWRRGIAIAGLATAATVAFVVVGRPSRVPSVPITQITPSAVRVIVDSADASNDARVEQELLEELELRRGELRPETEAAVRASLQTIDSAIVEIRTEMVRRPNDPALAQLLAEAYAHKVDLMKLLANAS
ncbi:MAG TPA: hypothetical protein VFA43_16655 [Gemmatimonadaceae bacterium]|nr:hypothetical protein [Gemmatimonadaceae bacterium]